MRYPCPRDDLSYAIRRPTDRDRQSDQPAHRTTAIRGIKNNERTIFGKYDGEQR